MILEVAMLNVIPQLTAEFEKAFAAAREIISRQNGFVSLNLQRCIERKSCYLLLVNWRGLEDHTQGFRNSTDYLEWKRLLHHFYDPFPTVEHYETVL